MTQDSNEKPSPKKRGPKPGTGGGGNRPGAGRPKTDQKFVSKNVRVPEDMMKEAENLGIVKGSLTKHVISGLKKEIKSLKIKKAKK